MKVFTKIATVAPTANEAPLFMNVLLSLFQSNQWESDCGYFSKLGVSVFTQNKGLCCITIDLWVPSFETITLRYIFPWCVMVPKVPFQCALSRETTHFGFPRRSWTVAQSRQTVGGCFESKKVPRMKNSKNRKRNIPHISRERKRTGIALIINCKKPKELVSFPSTIIINCKKKKGEEEEVGRLKMTSAFQFLRWKHSLGKSVLNRVQENGFIQFKLIIHSLNDSPTILWMAPRLFRKEDSYNFIYKTR